MKGGRLSSGQVQRQLDLLKDLRAVLEKHRCIVVPITGEESAVWFSSNPNEGDPYVPAISFEEAAGDISVATIKAVQEEILFKALGKGKLK